MSTIEQQLAQAQDCADGWMAAYYRQLNRTLRLEGALADLAIATPAQQPWAVSRANAILKEAVAEGRAHDLRY